MKKFSLTSLLEKIAGREKTSDVTKFSLAMFIWTSLLILPAQTSNTQVIVIHETKVVEKVVYKESPTEDVLCDLVDREGEGDNLTEIPTGKLGVTESARKATGSLPEERDSRVALKYLKLLESNWERVRGWEEAPAPVKEALLDSSYNMGEKVLGFPKAISYLKSGDYEGVVKSLLNTANVDGKSVKGLAKRRAELYNEVGDNPITSIKQKEDGTILYMVDQDILFQYRPSGGKHEKSKAGTINLDPAPSVM